MGFFDQLGIALSPHRVGLSVLMLFLAGVGRASELKVSESLWNRFSAKEQATLLEKFPSVELVKDESLGTIVGAQSANRSTPGTAGGAVLGGALAEAAYIDRALGGGSYSAVNQLGAALLGAFVGSSLDRKPQTLFEFNYAVKTLDGHVRELRKTSLDEFARPVGQCVSLPDLQTLAPASCSVDKVTLLKALSNLSLEKEASERLLRTPIDHVSCKVPGVGLMTLDRLACQEMEGVVQ